SSPASVDTTSLPPDMIAVPCCVPWSDSRTTPACCRNKSGMKRTCRKHTCIAAVLPARPILSCGRIRNTCVCFAPVMTAKSDLIPEVAARYLEGKTDTRVDFWLPKHPIQQVRKGHTLRICAPEPFRLRWTTDN